MQLSFISAVKNPRLEWLLTCQTQSCHHQHQCTAQAKLTAICLETADACTTVTCFDQTSWMNRLCKLQDGIILIPEQSMLHCWPESIKASSHKVHSTAGGKFFSWQKGPEVYKIFSRFERLEGDKFSNLSQKTKNK